MKVHIWRTDGYVQTLLLPHKDGSGWSYINLTKGHICPCVFQDAVAAIDDLKNHDDILHWEVVE